jgi:hypothetical protein
VRAKVMDILKELEKMPPKVRYELSFRALVEIIRAGTLIMERLSLLADRMEKLLDRAEAQAWATAIRAELERKKGKDGWIQPTIKRQSKKSS